MEARIGPPFPDPLELELKSLVSCHVVLGIEPGSSARAASALTAGPSPSALATFFIKVYIELHIEMLINIFETLCAPDIFKHFTCILITLFLNNVCLLEFATGG